MLRIICSVLALSAGFLISVPVLAQAVEEPDAATLVVQPTKRYAGNFVWERLDTFGSVGEFNDVAASPIDPNLVLLVTDRGEVWRSEDGGGYWLRVLAPIVEFAEQGEVDDEAVLLEAESTLEDLVEELDEYDVYESVYYEADPLADPDDVEADVPEDADDAMPDDTSEMLEVVSQWAVVEDGSSEAAASWIWFFPGVDGPVFVGRSDGLWRSVDGGRSFRRAQVDQPVRALALDMQRGVLLAATDDGVRYSLDSGQAWMELTDGTAGLAMLAFTFQVDRIWASTTNGLYHTTSGTQWERLPALGLPIGQNITQLVSDEAWDGGLWLVTARGLYRSDDGGQTVRVASRQPLTGIADAIRGGGVGHLLVAGADGVWESIDSGMTFKPVIEGLTTPHVMALTRTAKSLLAVAESTLWRLVPAPDEPPPVIDVNAEDLAQAPRLGVLLESARGRTGLSLSGERLTAAAASLRKLVPQLQLDFSYYDDDNFAADYIELGNGADVDNGWDVMLRFKWGTRSSSGTSAFDQLDVGGDRAFVLGGQVYATNGSDVIAAAAQTSEESIEYQAVVAERVTRLYVTWKRLVQDRPLYAREPVQRRVFHQLRIEEAEARIDALTDGAWTRGFGTNNSEDDS